ncbi:MAG: HEAT repeat domain-containing protein [Fibrobacterota bacterium]|nr:MAG: HEAT repeat domain-containing protein [Fibrobacterota bacterium]
MIPIPRKTLALGALAAALVLGGVFEWRRVQQAKEQDRVLRVVAAFASDLGRCRIPGGLLSDTLRDRIRRSGDRPAYARWLDSVVRADPDKDRQRMALDLLGTALLGNPRADALLDSLSGSRRDSGFQKEIEFVRMSAGTARGLRALVRHGDSVGIRDWPGFFWILGDLDTHARGLRERIDNGLAGRERSAFLRAMGWTRDTFWRARLEQALMDPTNWLHQTSAASALGDLGDRRSIEALQAQASSHWHLQVRQAASHALERISRGDTLAIPDWRADLLLHGLFEFNMPPGDPLVRQDSLRPLRACRSLDSKELGEAVWGAVLHGWADGPTTQTIRQAAQVSVPWDKGWLLGASRGEWGGEFAWRSPDGKIEVLDSLPVDTFLCTDHGILTLSAGGHFGAVGELSQVVGGADGRPRRVPFRLLPGSGCRWGMRERTLVFRCSHGEMPLPPALRNGPLLLDGGL